METLFVLIFLLTPTIALASLNPKQATDLVVQSLKEVEISHHASYCAKGTMTCRTMYHVKDKVSGKPSKIFYDTFYSSDRQVASTCYFIPVPKSPDEYYMLTDDSFDGVTEIHRVSPLFAKISVNEKGERTYANLSMPKLGTSFVTLADMIESEKKVVVEGVTKDTKNPKDSSPVKLEYFRMEP